MLLSLVLANGGAWDRESRDEPSLFGARSRLVLVARSCALGCVTARSDLRPAGARCDAVRVALVRCGTLLLLRVVERAGF